MSKNLIIPLFTGALLGLSSLSYAQTQKMKKEGTNGQPSLVTFEQDKAAKITAPVTDVFKRVLKLNDNASYKALSKESSANGLSDEKYQLYYKNLKVEFSTYAAHFKNGSLTSINGDYYPIADLNTQPSINEKTVLANALKTVQSKKFAWQVNSFLERSYTEPKGELVVLPFSNKKNDTKQYLAYKFDVFSIAPLYRAHIYVDAHTGEVVFTNQISRGEQESPLDKLKKSQKPNTSGVSNAVVDNASAINNIAAGTPNADTRYSGKRYIETSQQPDGKYILLDKTRGDGIHTKSAGFQGDLVTGAIPPEAISEIMDNDNVWTKEELGEAKTGNLHAIDAQWASGLVYDFYKEVFNRNSIDNKGKKLDNYIHFQKDFENASWTGEYMVYGDGKNTYTPLTPVDVTAHEIGHGLTQHTAGLIYENQSGALNESFSDMWGAAVEHKYAPEKKTWEIAEDIKIGGGFLRSLENPKAAGQPDTYKGTGWFNTDGCEIGPFNDYCGVHGNSGVTNHWFYILSQGKSGTNDVGITYNVTGIGIDKAAQIAYRTLSQYLTPKSNLEQMRDGAVQAATDLYGERSPEYIETINAFNAVNLGGRYDTQPPSSTNLKLLNVTTHSVKLSWDVATDDQGIKEYQLLQNGTLIKTIDAKANPLTYRVIELDADTPYKYQVVVVDLSNNTTKSKAVDTRTLTLPQIDTQKPSAPVLTNKFNPFVLATTLSWTVSTDDVEVVGYEIYVNNEKKDFVRDVQEYVVKNLQYDTTYTFYVVAVDEDGNRSEKSNEEVLVIAPEPCTPLSILRQTAVKEVQFADLHFARVAQPDAPHNETLDVVATVEKGKTYKVDMKRFPAEAPGFKMSYAAWIDYNGNGKIDVATETAYFTLSDLDEYSYNITIPQSAKATGNKPVIIRFGHINAYEYFGNYSDPSKHNIPCNGLVIGSYDDFGIIIKESLSTTETDAKEKISIYPNPVHDKLYIQKAKADTNYQIFSIDGKRVKQGTYKEGIDVSLLSAGVYMIKTNANGTESTQKFIKK